MRAVEILEFPFPTHQPLRKRVTKWSSRLSRLQNQPLREVQSDAQDFQGCKIPPDWVGRLILICQVILACGWPYGGTTWHLSLTPLEWPHILIFWLDKYVLHKALGGLQFSLIILHQYQLLWKKNITVCRAKYRGNWSGNEDIAAYSTNALPTRLRPRLSWASI